MPKQESSFNPNRWPKSDAEFLEYIQDYQKAIEDEDLVFQVDKASLITCENDDFIYHDPTILTMCEARSEEHGEIIEESRLNFSSNEAIFTKREITLAQAVYHANERYEKYYDSSDGSHVYSAKLFHKWIKRAYDFGMLSLGEGTRRKYKETLTLVASLKEQKKRIEVDLVNCRRELDKFSKERKEKALSYDESTKEKMK